MTDSAGNDEVKTLLLSSNKTLSAQKRRKCMSNRFRILKENANKKVIQSEEQARLAKASAKAAQRYAAEATQHAQAAARAAKATVNVTPSINAAKRSKAGADAAKVAADKANAAAERSKAAAGKARVACTKVNNAANKASQVATNPHLNPYPNPASVSSQNLEYALHAYAHTHTPHTHTHTHTHRPLAKALLRQTRSWTTPKPLPVWSLSFVKRLSKRQLRHSRERRQPQQRQAQPWKTCSRWSVWPRI